MKAVLAFLLAAGLCAAPLSARAVQEPAAHTVLSPEDVRLYVDIFAAQRNGQIARADAAIAKLSDKSLLGPVLLERYLGPRYAAKFEDLRSWLSKYNDVAGADRIYKLAKRKTPARSKISVPLPAPSHWRGSLGEGDVFNDTDLQSDLARRMAARMQTLANDGKPQAAEAALKTLPIGPKLPQSDADRLTSYVAAAYLAENRDDAALALAESVIERGSDVPSRSRWTAGLASYRLNQFERAARHFDALSELRDNAARTTSGAAFWAARSWMLSGHSERVLTLYTRAASRPDTFYGMLAVRLLGKEPTGFTEPALDVMSFARLMQDQAAHRAVALWQIGRTETIATELGRAFGEISPDLDPAFAALARHLGVPSLELRAAELVFERDIRLTSLYPIPPYQPKGGYLLDRAVVLAFARQESRFEPAALSKRGARGVMQIMPTTAAIITHDPTLARTNKERLDDPSYSMTLGQEYLRGLLDRQNGNLVGLAAAYNAGAGNLDKWMAQHDGIDDPLLFIESIPASETRDYIKRVITNMWMYHTRLGEPAAGLNDAASGVWPIYRMMAP